MPSLDAPASPPHARDDVLSAAASIAAPIPIGDEGPVFAEPWEAQAFALTVALHARGVFAWDEWAQALARAIRDSEAAGDGAGYYAHWLAALEALLARKGLAARDVVSARAESWRRAAEATPHGTPIRLENDPLFRGADVIADAECDRGPVPPGPG